MSQVLEATQFTVADYEKFLADPETASKNVYRQNGMKAFKTEVENPKSELNRKLGGIKNIVRVRVMKDKQDDSKIFLVYNFKVQPKELDREKRQEEVKQELKQVRQFPLFLPDVKGLVMAALNEARVNANMKGLPKETLEPIEKATVLLMDGWGEEEKMNQARVLLTDAASSFPLELDRRQGGTLPDDIRDKYGLVFTFLDYAQSLLHIYMIEYTRSNGLLVEMARQMFREGWNPPKKDQGRPNKPSHRHQQPRGEKKPSETRA